MLEACRGKWRVVLDRDLQVFFEKRGLGSALEEWRRSLEESLNKDPGEVMRLLREPIIRRIRGVNVRRYRLYLSGIGFRLLFILNNRSCIVAFIGVEKRDEETYRRFHRRL